MGMRDYIIKRLIEQKQAETYIGERQGVSVLGRAVTAQLFVSPLGSGLDGLSWTTAFPTIPEALDAASTNTNAATLLNIGPHPTYYDINMTGDPTWAANVILKGSHRAWAPIRNTHAAATSVFKFTGKASIMDLAIFTFDTVNGVIFTQSGYRVRKCGFNSQGLTGPATSIHIDGSAALIRGGKIDDTEIIGHVSHTTGIYMNCSSISKNRDVSIHDCLVGLHILGATSDLNEFMDMDMGDSAKAIIIAAGNKQHFKEITFHGNTMNVDDAVKDSIWQDIRGAFPIEVLPNDLVGITINTGAAGVYGADIPILAAAGRTKPFRIVGYSVQPSTSEWYQLRLSADSGSSFFDVIQFDGTKNQGVQAPSGTEHIFNAGTRISGSARDVSGGDNVKVWLAIQEI